MFDMGPYYLTALVALLGPIRDIAGMTRISKPERTIASEPNKGRKIKVEVPTHVTFRPAAGCPAFTARKGRCPCRIRTRSAGRFV